ncbi:hypothetical protein O181_115925 [Austropuccinia psidii MF-1]|uniref:Uncharacterized protein n=1 Tax=Austropuccinia psidii MF-1 TaxID=1389203 RepID=A0A9Q3K7E1_9BASI|nr:hypothetical protein [Austropuccinia psidii MF-1]
MPQRFLTMENGKQEVQHSLTLGRAWRRLPEDMSQRGTFKRTYGNHQRVELTHAVQNLGGKGSQDKGESSHYPSHRRTTEPDRASSDSFRHTRSKPTRLPSSFTPFRNQNISGQESP